MNPSTLPISIAALWMTIAIVITRIAVIICNGVDIMSDAEQQIVITTASVAGFSGLTSALLRAPIARVRR